MYSLESKRNTIQLCLFQLCNSVLGMTFGCITQKSPKSEVPRIKEVIFFIFSGITRDIGCFPLEQDSLKLHFFISIKKKSFLFPFLLLMFLGICSFLQSLDEIIANHLFLPNENTHYGEENICRTGREVFLQGF